MISVILPYYNGERFIREAVDSILAQSYRDFELLLIDDGSSRPPDTAYLKQLVAERQDDRIKYFYKTNGGLSDARNFGIDHSSGELIAFIDQDDVWQHDKLAEQVRVFQDHPEVNFVMTEGTIFGEENRDYGLVRKRGLSEGVVPDTYAMMLRGNLVIASSAIFRRQMAALAGPSNRQFVVAPDYEYFMRFAARTDFYFIATPLVHYRHHDANTVRQRMRLYLESISILMSCTLSTRRQVLLASRQFAKLHLKILGLWISKVLSRSEPRRS